MIKEQQNFASFNPVLGVHSQLNQEQIQQYQQQALVSYIKQLEQRERHLSQENQKLKEESAKMQEKIMKYESKQGEMINEIQDMQTLLKRVYLEGEIQAGIMRKKNIELSNENQVLENLQMIFNKIWSLIVNLNKFKTIMMPSTQNNLTQNSIRQNDCIIFVNISLYTYVLRNQYQAAVSQSSGQDYCSNFVKEKFDSIFRKNSQNLILNSFINFNTIRK